MSIDRIGKSGSAGSAGKSRKASRSGGAGNFSRLLGEEEEGVASSGAAHGGASVSGISALLAMQQVDPDGGAGKRARQRGEMMLRALERLRGDILTGQISEATMKELAAHVAQARGEVVDPRLAGILDEIDLRVQVELAKLDMARRD